MKRIFKAVLLGLVAVIVVGMPVLAAVSYRAAYTIVESGGTAYDMLPTSVLVDNQWLADNGFLQDDALDTRIETLGGLLKPHMVATNKTLTAVPVPVDSQTNLYFTTANSDLPSMDIIAGYDGYITIPDDATLELGSDFEIEQSGYVDTSTSGFYANLVHKRSSAGVSITDTEEITGIVYFDDPVDVSPGAGDLGGWTDIDISAYVPSYATGAVVRLYTSNVAEEIGVRINGCVQDLRGDVRGQILTMVGIDTNDIFQGWIEAVTCHIYIVGFTGSGVTYKAVADDISLGVALAWTDIDLSVEAPNAIGAIVAVDNTNAAATIDYGLRMNNSADARIDGVVDAGWYYGIVGCDGAQIIDGYVGALTVDFYLVGYITDNFTFNQDGTDKSLAAGFADWTDIDCIGDVTNLTTHIIFEVVAASKDYGFRRNGSAENIHPEQKEHCWVVVECDENQVVEMWAEDNTVDCYIIGYTEGYISSPYEVSATATDIASGEYTVKTYGVANEPEWATGDVLHFTGAADSNVNAGAIHDASAKLWISFWFKLDQPFDATSPADLQLSGKFVAGTDYMVIFLLSASGRLGFVHRTGGVTHFQIFAQNGGGTITSWEANRWYHVLASISDTVGVGRLIIDNGTAVLTNDVNPLVNGGDFIIGDGDDPGGGVGLIGEIQNVIAGTDDLSEIEEDALYAGTAPGDETNYWYIDEGTGTNIVDYGTGGNDGTADAACTWETATYTTGSTGRLCDFYIEVDDGVTGADRWGANLKGASVPGNNNDWILNQNNVMPYMDYYKHTVSGVEHAWYQPNYMVEGTDSGGTETAGGSAVLITAVEITEGIDYWVNALVTITSAGGVAPEGEARVCSASAVGSITVAPAFSANVDIGDTFTVDFGTLIDRSYYGLDFDGDDFIDAGDDVSLRLSGNRFWSVWVKPTSIGTNQVILWKSLDNVNAYTRFDIYLLVAGTFRVRTFNPIFGTVIATSTTVATGSDWYMVSGLVDASGLSIFINGVIEGVPTAYSGLLPAVSGEDALQIGRYKYGANVGSYFIGTIDEVMVYDEALTPSEIEDEWNGGVGVYAPVTTTGLVGHWHIEEGSGATIADSSGEGNTGTITGAIFANGFVPRPAGNSGTNDSRITWGVNPTGVDVSLGGMVSEGQPTPGALPDDPAQDILPETEVTDWYIEPDVTGTLLTNPLRPFVTMWSDNSTLTELQCWRIYALALILLITVATAMAVGHHQGITMIAAGVALLGAVVLTIFPMWALVFAIGMFIGGLVMERSPSL